MNRILLLVLVTAVHWWNGLFAADPLVISSQAEWSDVLLPGSKQANAAGYFAAASNGQSVSLKSSAIAWKRGRRLKQLRIRQSPSWTNWQPVANVGPAQTRNAPVFLPVADKNYWYFAAKGKSYHAFFSTDMKQWVDRGPVGQGWVTTAEYIDNKLYVYYDKPNDQDPHLTIGTINGDQVHWQNQGMVFPDPSHGSDCGVIRTSDGLVHLIYEDWTPIDASKYSWDSPLAGRVVSRDGITGFSYGSHPPAVDVRTKATGETGTFQHRPSGKQPLSYQKHSPDQDAFGDWTALQLGDSYYLFGDYHPASAGPGKVGNLMQVGMFHSSSMDKTFQFMGSFGQGHPDPTVGFAEGQFYLLVQSGKTDWVSPGPWTGTIKARVGVDTTKDGQADTWTQWQELRERYSKKKGFARVVDVEPAVVDCRALPAGSHYYFEIEAQDAEISAVELH